MGCKRCAALVVRLGSGHIVSDNPIDIARPKGAAANRRRGRHRPALAWLLAASLVALGTAETLSVASAKPASAHHKKSAAARHKHKGEREKVETKRPGHVIDQAAAGEANRKSVV